MRALNSIQARLCFIFLLNLFFCVRAVAQEYSFVKIPAGTYQVGRQGHLKNPLRKINLSSFEIGKTEITNQQFEEFVKATDYKTDAERHYIAMVFEPGLDEFKWLGDSTAYWRFPNGISRGGIENKMNHPVTCISYIDALAYCKWAGYRLPTLDEWEVACRAGTDTDFYFGKNASAISTYANIWLGHDHLKADNSDGYLYTAPVASFAPNPWGLYDMYGNVFELCSGSLKGDANKNIVHARGGSWWCSKSSCNYFNSYDIGRVNLHASFSNQGFRVAK